MSAIQTPKIDIKRFTGFVTSDTIVVVIGALIVTPILFGILNTFALGKIPLARDNLMIALFLASIILFILSTIFSGKIRLLLLGASAGAVVSAIQQSSFVQGIIGRISAAVPGGP